MTKAHYKESRKTTIEDDEFNPLWVPNDRDLHPHRRGVKKMSEAKVWGIASITISTVVASVKTMPMWVTIGIGMCTITLILVLFPLVTRWLRDHEERKDDEQRGRIIEEHEENLRADYEADLDDY